MNLLTRSERNVVAHVFAGFLFNPMLDFYPKGVTRVLQEAGLLKNGDDLESDEVTVAYEAQMRDLLFLETDSGPPKGPSPDRVTATAFDIVVKYRDSLACFEVKFLSRWRPSQLKVELEDCERLNDHCDLVLLYPSWRNPRYKLDVLAQVKKLMWEHVRDACAEFSGLGGVEIVRWMENLCVPHQIHDDGSFGKYWRGLFTRTCHQQNP